MTDETETYPDVKNDPVPTPDWTPPVEPPDPDLPLVDPASDDGAGPLEGNDE